MEVVSDDDDDDEDEDDDDEGCYNMSMGIEERSGG